MRGARGGEGLLQLKVAAAATIECSRHLFPQILQVQAIPSAAQTLQKCRARNWADRPERPRVPIVPATYDENSAKVNTLEPLRPWKISGSSVPRHMLQQDRSTVKHLICMKPYVGALRACADNAQVGAFGDLKLRMPSCLCIFEWLPHTDAATGDILLTSTVLSGRSSYKIRELTCHAEMSAPAAADASPAFLRASVASRAF